MHNQLGYYFVIERGTKKTKNTHKLLEVTRLAKPLYAKDE